MSYIRRKIKTERHENYMPSTISVISLCFGLVFLISCVAVGARSVFDWIICFISDLYLNSLMLSYRITLKKRPGQDTVKCIKMKKQRLTADQVKNRL